MHEAFGKFVMRHQPPSKTIAIQILRSSYGFQLWFYNKAPISYHMKILDKMQRRAAIWILGAFKMSLSEGIEAIAGIIPIKFHLQKLARRLQICPFKLSTNHILRELMNDLPISSNKPNPHAVSSLTN